MPSTKITVYDAEGTARTVAPVDASEIVAAGGSYDAPVVESVAPVEESKKTTAKKAEK